MSNTYEFNNGWGIHVSITVPQGKFLSKEFFQEIVRKVERECI